MTYSVDKLQLYIHCDKNNDDDNNDDDITYLLW